MVLETEVSKNNAGEKSANQNLALERPCQGKFQQATWAKK